MYVVYERMYEISDFYIVIYFVIVKRDSGIDVLLELMFFGFFNCYWFNWISVCFRFWCFVYA